MASLLPKLPLLLVTDLRQARWPFGSIVECAYDAGCRWISIREKHLPREQQIALAAEARVGAQGDMCVTIHGDAELARDAWADGVHLSSGSDPIATRTLLGEGALIGLSVHSLAEIDALSEEARAALDYVIAGPAHPTASKPGYRGEFTETGYAALVCRCGTLPVVAIGGIEPGNIAPLIDQGVTGIAVMGGVMRAPDAGLAVHSYLAALEAAHAKRVTGRSR